MPVQVSGCLVPTAAEIVQLQRELEPRFEEDRLGFQILPFRSTEMSEIVLRQPDIFKGLQPFRGLGKPVSNVPDRYNYFGTTTRVIPGYWGEKDEIPEEVMTTWAQPGACNQMLDLTAYTAELQRNLMERRYNRIEYNIWQLLAFGLYQALNSAGQVVHQAQFNVTNISAAIPWSNFPGSFPLRDLRAVQLLGRGTSARFDSCARAYMNRVTANALFSNTNPADVGRVGLSACCNFMGIGQINEQFLAQGLPQIVIYDGGYMDDNNNFNVYIPDGYVIIVGCRPGDVPPGHYYLTRNAVGCTVDSGFWQMMIDNCGREIPRKIQLVDGHNGGPALEYPRQVVVLRVL